MGAKADEAVVNVGVEVNSGVEEYFCMGLTSSLVGRCTEGKRDSLRDSRYCTAAFKETKLKLGSTELNLVCR